MRIIQSFRRMVALVVIACGPLLFVASTAHDAHACGSETYRGRGVVKSFGPSRASVDIAHEKIEGYMPAMTMSFEARTQTQLAGLREGDAVTFAFTATEDGRRIIDSIVKA